MNTTDEPKPCRVHQPDTCGAERETVRSMIEQQIKCYHRKIEHLEIIRALLPTQTTREQDNALLQVLIRGI